MPAGPNCKFVCLFVCLWAESVYSHSLVVDGREITLNIWDSPYSEVTDTHCVPDNCYDWFRTTGDVIVQEKAFVESVNIKSLRSTLQ